MLPLRSSFGWLSFKSSEIDEARALISSFKEEGVVDELGFRPLTGAFAERFYPATNTIMTRSRYLFFVSAVYRGIEKRSARTRVDVPGASRNQQDQLREVLEAHEPIGVIGRDAKKAVKRLPSNVYWSALKELGIFRWDVSENSYQEGLSAPTRRVTVKDDDGTVIGGSDDSPWDPKFRFVGLDESSGDFISSTTFRLTQSEARELRRRWMVLDERRGLGPSLLSHLVATGDEWRSDDLPILWPWNARGLTEELLLAVTHAKLVSLCARGIVLQYHQMLLDRRPAFRLERLPDDMRPCFIDWWDQARPLLLRWKIDELRALLAAWGFVPRPADLAFLSGWLGRVGAAGDAVELFDDPQARELIRTREKAQRPNKARLKSRVHLDQWTPRLRNDCFYEISFRHSIGFQFAQDIAEGLGD